MTPGIGAPGDSIAVIGDILHCGERKTGTVVLAGGVITEMAVGRAVRPSRGYTYEFADGLILPGLIDLHVHGGGGHAAFGGHEQLLMLGRWLAANGVTGFLASVPAMRWCELLAASHAVAAACAAGEVRNLLGLHVEGPHLSPARAGSQDRAHLRAPSLTDYRALRAAAGLSLRMMTIAPELPGSLEVIEACRRDGVIAAMGHTDALYAQAMNGFAAGVTHVTHLFNAMRPFHQREPGALGAALTAPGGVTAELILDGEHIHRGAWDLARRALGPDRLILVSDALPCAGLEQGPGGQRPEGPASQWLGRNVTRRGGRLELDDGTLAGSDVTVLDAVRRAISWGATVQEAVAAVTQAPAAVLGLGARKGRLLPGFDADVTVVDREWRACLTIVGGRRVWPCQRQGAPAEPKREPDGGTFAPRHM